MVDILIGGKSYTPAELEVLSKAGVLNIGAKHDTSSATPSFAPPHGPIPGSSTQFGVFSDPGVRPGVWDATPRVQSFAASIPMYQSLNANELIEVATGVTVPQSMTNQTSACVVGPKPGQLKAMKIAATFGIIHASSKIFDITQAGMRKNRADVDRVGYNNARTMNAWLPEVPGIDGGGYMNDAMRAEFHALGANLERDVSKVHFLGTASTEDNTYFGVARQWNGLDALIKTGYVDSETGVAAEAADSTVISFNAEMDGGTDADSRTIVGAMTDTYFAQMDYLESIGISPVFALVMRPDQFRALASVWSCSFATTRCTSSSAGIPVTRDAVSTYGEYLSIHNGRYLPMEGVNVPVLFDTSIPRVGVGPGHYKADIYGVAMTGNGRPVIYGEFFDMNNPEAQAIANLFPSNSETTTTNGGMYRVFKRVTGGCYEFDFFARPRLITDAPFMHFRIDDIRYKAAYNQHDAVPGMSHYANGGTTFRT